MSKPDPKDNTIPCPREGCVYRTADAKRLLVHIERAHDDQKRNERREELMKRRSVNLNE